ncbi:MAG: 5'/3'-nucleotidase SurE [Actinobacteria bacterium]|nr:5'/3'-nucleotidase SurE [Cyanobacteriota bacterium]MCL5771341.1 5'/3'-nucleotidase SurE [Actinomycetota bacterium]
MTKKLILLTNDDGIEARGIYALYKTFINDDEFEIKVIAPEFERSAVGHAITVFDPIWVKREYKDGEFFGFGVNGTPADCVKLYNELLGTKPDLLISGINRGANVGENIIYSGTVSAATEGIANGIPSIAVSIDCYTEPDYNFSAKFTKKIVKMIFKHNNFPEKTLLNINIPDLSENEIKGIKITKQSDAKFKDYFLKRSDPRGRDYYWMDGEFIEISKCEEGDYCAIKNGYISITPIQYDMTDYKRIDYFRKWDIKINER